MVGMMRHKLKVWAGVMVLAVLALTGCQPSASSYTTNYFYTRTADGYNLALRRYRPAKLNPAYEPVLLCHGLSYNLLFWDLREEVSLPRYLAANGYDVWSVSLRGASPSSQPLNSSLRKIIHFNIDPQKLRKVEDRLADVRLLDWTVDDHIEYDVPAVINFILEKTNQERLHWVGHSMGGMIMMAFLEQAEPERVKQVKSVVGVSVPMVVFHPLSEPLQFLVDAQPAIGIGSRIVGSSITATWGVIFADFGQPTGKLFYNSDNINSDVLRELYRVAEEEISPGQLDQLIHMIRTERFTSKDGTVDYTQDLVKINTPVYLLVGTVDNLATVGAVRYAFRQVNSPVKQFGLFGRVNSQKRDYGHNDIILGKNARREVYPAILNWLDRFPHKAVEKTLPLQPVERQPEAQSDEEK